MAYSVTNGIIKIPSAGDFFTMGVVKCEVVESKYKNPDQSFKEEVKFTDSRGQAFFVPRKTADFQLGKWCGFGEQNPDGSWHIAYGDVDGHALTFRRDPNPNDATKPYYGIRKADETEDVSHRPSLKEAAQAEAERVRVAKGLPSDDDGSLGPKIPGLDDVPPPTDADSPYNDEDGMPSVKATAHPQAPTETKETAINAAYDRAWNVALTVQGGFQTSTPEAVQAGAATLLIAYRQAGVC